MWQRTALSEEPREGQYDYYRQRKAEYDSDREDKANEVNRGQTSGSWTLGHLDKRPHFPAPLEVRWDHVATF